MTRCLSNYLAIVLMSLASAAPLKADRSGRVTLAPGNLLSLDSGAVSDSGDVLWNGSALVSVGRASLYNLGKYGARAYRSIDLRKATSVSYNAHEIQAASLATGDIFGVHTNAGAYAKVVVTARDYSSLSLEYTVFRSSAARPAAVGGTPVITGVQNNFSWILSGQPNYGIAPGSIFVITGTALSAAGTPVLQVSSGAGLPVTLNQTAIAVTVKGMTTTPAFLYTSTNQIAAVLPSTTPVGTGTITVTYNGAASAPFPIQVVASAVGLDTLYGAGNGLAVASTSNFNFITPLNSAAPGQPVIFWGSGVGADTNNNDRVYPQTEDNLTGIPLQFFIGGIEATVSYRGRSAYPGFDQYNVTIPPNVTPGCFVSVVAQTGSVVSNTVTIPISANGGTCTDAITGLNGAQIESLASQPSGTVKTLAAIVTVGGPGSSLALAGALNSGWYGQGYEYVSTGSCIIVPPNQGSFSNLLTAALDAGTIQVNGPTGKFSLGSGPGLYQFHQNSAPGGTYTITGSGGKDIGAFQVTLNVPTPTLNVTNQAALASVTRSQGATIAWTGGFPNGFVQIEGSSGAPALKFFCYAPTSAGQITVPSSILLAVPPGPGSITVTDLTAPQMLSAPGADLALAAGGNNNSPKIDAIFH